MAAFHRLRFPLRLLPSLTQMWRKETVSMAAFLASGSLVYEIRLAGELVAREETTFDGRRIAGHRKSVDGSNRYEVEAELSQEGIVRRVRVRYDRGPQCRDGQARPLPRGRRGLPDLPRPDPRPRPRPRADAMDWKGGDDRFRDPGRFFEQAIRAMRRCLGASMGLRAEDGRFGGDPDRSGGTNRAHDGQPGTRSEADLVMGPSQAASRLRGIRHSPSKVAPSFRIRLGVLIVH